MTRFALTIEFDGTPFMGLQRQPNGPSVQGAIEKAIPVVGLILCVESAVAATVDLALTTTAIAQSPFTYVTDLVFTHDLAVVIGHQTSEPTFPAAANLMRVIATFDDGQPVGADYVLSRSDGYPASVPSVRTARITTTTAVATTETTRFFERARTTAA